MHACLSSFRRIKFHRNPSITLQISRWNAKIQFLDPDYDPDRAQKLISSSMSRHLSTCNISSKSMHAFLSNFANRQTDKGTRATTHTPSFVGGNNYLMPLGPSVLLCLVPIVTDNSRFSGEISRDFTALFHSIYSCKNSCQNATARRLKCKY